MFLLMQESYDSERVRSKETSETIALCYCFVENSTIKQLTETTSLDRSRSFRIIRFKKLTHR